MEGRGEARSGCLCSEVQTQTLLGELDANWVPGKGLVGKVRQGWVGSGLWSQAEVWLEINRAQSGGEVGRNSSARTISFIQ